MSKQPRPVGITTPEGEFVLLYGHSRLAKFRIEAIKLVLTGCDLRKAAELVAPRWVGSCFSDWTKDKREEKIRSIRKDIRNCIANLTDEDKKHILKSKIFTL
jgi:hypothetical protein